MELKKIGSNMREGTTAKGVRVLVSYETPVAAHNPATDAYVRTTYKWSSTTTRHISKWLNGAVAGELPQSYFNSLYKE